MNDEHEKKKKERKEGVVAPPINNSRIKSFIKRDFFYIVICLFALFACLLTINSSLEIQNECNERWEAQIKAAGCFLDPINNTAFQNLPEFNFENPNVYNLTPS